MGHHLGTLPSGLSGLLEGQGQARALFVQVSARPPWGGQVGDEVFVLHLSRDPPPSPLHLPPLQPTTTAASDSDLRSIWQEQGKEVVHPRGGGQACGPRSVPSGLVGPGPAVLPGEPWAPGPGLNGPQARPTERQQQSSQHPPGGSRAQGLATYLLEPQVSLHDLVDFILER